MSQLNEWLQREHVHRWWSDTNTLEETIAYYAPALRGEEPTDHYVIVVDGRDAGMVETYLVSDYPDYEALVEVGFNVAGVDLLLGEPDVIGRGLGPETLRRFTREVIFADAAVAACTAGVDVENRRSLRAFEKAGFKPVREYEEDGRPHRLLRLDRLP